MERYLASIVEEDRARVQAAHFGEEQGLHLGEFAGITRIIGKVDLMFLRFFAGQRDHVGILMFLKEGSSRFQLNIFHQNYSGWISIWELDKGYFIVLKKHRLKIAGAWWTLQNAEAMLQLRTTRSNNDWDRYWSELAKN